MNGCSNEIKSIAIPCGSEMRRDQIQKVVIYKAPTDKEGYACYEAEDGKAKLINSSGDEVVLTYPVGTGNSIKIGDVAVIE